MQPVLKLWRMPKLSLEGKIIVFKSLAISKIVHLSLLTNVPNKIVEELIKIQKKLFMELHSSKNKTFNNSYGLPKCWVKEY